jgi:diketogulonate reductase-like aldo/keto reductase
MLKLHSTLPLNDGHEIPIFGLGVYQSPPGRPTQDAVQEALRQGYRHVDTAALYGNEADVGRALRASGIPRDEVFVTTKLWNSEHGYDAALRACERSLKTLGLDRIDLYLIHWPVEKRRLDSWRALTRLQDEGVCRSIGVSNYTIGHLEELARHSDRVPCVNQVELSPFLAQPELRNFCHLHKIVVEAYSPLTRGRRLGDPVVGTIAAAHSKTPAQVLLRWAIQHEMVVIPKSVRPARIAENAAIFGFALSDVEMARLDGLDENYRICWDPTNVGLEAEP